jgi:histidine triad (HIT) family protein
MAENCIFCKIVGKQAPASIVYEDDLVLAFMDIRPVSEGHTLVVPKQHYVDLFDIPKDVIAAVYTVAKPLAAAAKQATKADGISIIQQNGKAAGQDIFHLHVHIIPRFDGRKLPRFEELSIVSRGELDDVAEKIKKELQ